MITFSIEIDPLLNTSELTFERQIVPWHSAKLSISHSLSRFWHLKALGPFQIIMPLRDHIFLDNQMMSFSKWTSATADYSPNLWLSRHLISFLQIQFCRVSVQHVYILMLAALIQDSRTAHIVAEFILMVQLIGNILNLHQWHLLAMYRKSGFWICNCSIQIILECNKCMPYKVYSESPAMVGGCPTRTFLALTMISEFPASRHTWFSTAV